MMSMNPRHLPVYQKPFLPTISIDSSNGWSIAPEGYVTKDSSLIKIADSLALPAFNDLIPQKYFIDVFISKAQPLQWSASVSEDWIQLSKSSGQLYPEVGKKEMRIWVDMDWNKMKNKKSVGQIIFAAGTKQIVVNVQANEMNKSDWANNNSFMENNGAVTIQAAHFNRRVDKPTSQWKVVSDLGYVENALQAFPLVMAGKLSTDSNSIKRNSAVVEYDFYTFSSAISTLFLFALPTHPINNNYNVRYAVSIDDGPLKIIDIKTFGRSDEWKQNVLRNRAERKIEMPFLNAGKHKLRLYTVDPGVILDEIRIDLGGLRKAYSALPETKASVIPRTTLK